MFWNVVLKKNSIKITAIICNENLGEKMEKKLIKTFFYNISSVHEHPKVNKKTGEKSSQKIT